MKFIAGVNMTKRYLIAFPISCLLLGVTIMETFGKQENLENENLFHIIFCSFLVYKCAIGLISRLDLKVWFSKLYILTEIVVYLILLRYFAVNSNYLEDMNSAMIDFVLHNLVLLLALRTIMKCKEIEKERDSPHVTNM